MPQAVSARGEAVRRRHRRRGEGTLQKGVWQTMGNHGTAKLWELRYSSPHGGPGEAGEVSRGKSERLSLRRRDAMLARLLELGNPLERAVTQSKGV